MISDNVRKSFVVYTDILSQISLLSDEELGQLFRAVVGYAARGEEIVTKNRVLQFAFKNMKTQIDRDFEKYEKIRQKRIEASKKGNLSRWGDKSQMLANGKQESQMLASVADSVSVSVSDNKEKTSKEVKKKTTKRFSPPSLEEVAAYCLERNNNIDPQTFIDFYTAKDWMVGKNKMKDWKAAVRTWERRNIPQRPADVDNEETPKTDPAWPKTQKWMQTHVPHVAPYVSQQMFDQMKSLAHFKNSVVSSILTQIEHGGDYSDILESFKCIAESEQYLTQILK